MTTFSFLILPKKSLLIEKDRYNNHSFIKTEVNFHIFARQLTYAITEGNKISGDYFEFIHSISNEIESTIYILIKELKNNESENDFSILKYFNSKGIIGGRSVLVLNKKTLTSYNSLYEFPFDDD